MFNSEDGKYTVYRVYSDQQAYDGWVSHNEWGIYSSFYEASNIVDDLLEKEKESMNKKDLGRRTVTITDSSTMSVENGVYAWQSYRVKKYILDEFLENDMYTEDPP